MVPTRTQPGAFHLNPSEVSEVLAGLTKDVSFVGELACAAETLKPNLAAYVARQEAGRDTKLKPLFLSPEYAEVVIAAIKYHTRAALLPFSGEAIPRGFRTREARAHHIIGRIRTETTHVSV